MKRYSLFLFAVLSLGLITSCDAIGTIFEAGMWWGILLVAAVLGLIIWLFSRNRNS